MQKNTIDPKELFELRTTQLRNILAQHGERFPQQLASRFPHILERILSNWNAHDKLRQYFKSLTATESRYGFPPDVLQEIFLLSKFFDRAHPPLEALRTDIWAGFTA
jgi:hypothetical protein